jgi:membrane protein implicated in regulation of membrane protease activity
MIVINIKAILTFTLFALAVVYGAPVWLALVAWLVAVPHFMWFAAGFLAGCFLPLSIGWNMAERARRDQAHDQADSQYEQRKRRLMK